MNAFLPAFDGRCLALIIAITAVIVIAKLIDERDHQ